MRTRVALIGAGAWATQAYALALLAQTHAPALLAQETVEVIGVVDPMIERTRASTTLRPYNCASDHR